MSTGVEYFLDPIRTSGALYLWVGGWIVVAVVISVKAHWVGEDGG